MAFQLFWWTGGPVVRERSQLKTIPSARLQFDKFDREEDALARVREVFADEEAYGVTLLCDMEVIADTHELHERLGLSGFPRVQSRYRG